MGKNMHACMHGGERKHGDVYARDVCLRETAVSTDLPPKFGTPPGLLSPPPPAGPPPCSPPGGLPPPLHPSPSASDAPCLTWEVGWIMC